MPRGHHAVSESEHIKDKKSARKPCGYAKTRLSPNSSRVLGPLRSVARAGARLPRTECVIYTSNLNGLGPLAKRTQTGPNQFLANGPPLRPVRWNPNWIPALI